MISIISLFEEGNFKKGMKAAGRTTAAGTGMALKGVGTGVSATGDALYNKFTDKKKEDNKNQEEKKS